MEVKANTLGIDLLGIDKDLILHRNLSVEQLADDILDKKEGVKGLNGATMVDTGIYTGRSPKDKFFTFFINQGKGKQRKVKNKNEIYSTKEANFDSISRSRSTV